MKKNVPKKITRFNIVFINLQLLFTFLTIGLFIWYLFDTSMMSIFQGCLGVTLLIMAYNNHIIYRKKAMTITYLVVGIVLLVLDLVLLVV